VPAKPLTVRRHQLDGYLFLNLLRIAAELAVTNTAYRDIASKFFEHFIYIAGAISNFGSNKDGLWDDADGFFYDQLHMPDGTVEKCG